MQLSASTSVVPEQQSISEGPTRETMMGIWRGTFGRFIKLLVPTVLLVVIGLFMASNGHSDRFHRLLPSIDKKLVGYYAQMQRSRGFTTNKLLTPKADFLPPWIASDWRDEDYKAYLEKIKASGMEYVVLQYVAKAEVVDGKATLTENYFHLNDVATNPHLSSIYNKCTDENSMLVSQSDVVENLLLASKEVGIKVYLGTLLSDQWWHNDFTDANWRTEMLELEKLLISYFITKYKTVLNMSDTFQGIYYTHEMYGNTLGYEEYWSEMLGDIRTFIDAQDPSLKFIASLYCSDHYLFSDSNGKTVEEQMRKFISNLLINKGKAVLKSGDIVSVQDKLSTHTKTSVEYSAKFLHAVHDALKMLATKHNNTLQYSIIVENFTPDFDLAPMERYILQLLICSQLSDDLMLYSYAGYHMPKDKLNRPNF